MSRNNQRYHNNFKPQNPARPAALAPEQAHDGPAPASEQAKVPRALPKPVRLKPRSELKVGDFEDFTDLVNGRSKKNVRETREFVAGLTSNWSAEDLRNIFMDQWGTLLVEIQNQFNNPDPN